MKKTTIITLCAAALTALGAHAQTGPTTSKDDLFAGTEIFAKNATNVTEISMDPESLGMVKGRDKDAARSMLLNVVHTYEYDKPGQYNIADVEKFRAKLMSSDWSCSVHTRDMKSGESTDVCTRHRSDDYVETAIITVEPKELTFIHHIVRRGGGTHNDTGYLSIPGGTEVFAALAPMAEVINGEVTAELSANGMRIKMHDMQKSLDKDQKSVEQEEKKLDKQKQKEEKNQPPTDDATPADSRA